MRILVVGAGATGGYFGARMALAGRDVTFLVREKRQAQLQKTGLMLKSPFGDVTLEPKLVTAQQLTGSWDVILLTVKSFALEQAMSDIAPAVGKDTLIIPILNGMRHIETLQARFGKHAVIGGLCKIHATLGEQGEIIQLSRLHTLFYGDLQGDNSERLQQLDSQLKDCGFDTVFSEAIQSDLWEKWLLLSTLGAVTCLARGNTQQIVHAPGGREFIESVFSEVLSVLDACGYQHREKVITGTREFLTNPDTALTSSMYRDLTHGFSIEAEQIIGDLVRRAAQHGVVTPLLNAVNVNLNVYLQNRA
ncbi:2-dehydropantoate 2-reductase [Mangrovibacter yixingensis]|uniref:2-dehydropantoate 2-reductase n=1 Tax=Mangrovibacter yixingensis TaxID=1529639 RepID=UPI001CF9E93D|nr:2-dehydropantoate 2-reductase [Mangrovibacter yixingensis]